MSSHSSSAFESPNGSSIRSIKSSSSSNSISTIRNRSKKKGPNKKHCQDEILEKDCIKIGKNLFFDDEDNVTCHNIQLFIDSQSVCDEMLKKNPPQYHSDSSLSPKPLVSNLIIKNRIEQFTKQQNTDPELMLRDMIEKEGIFTKKEIEQEKQKEMHHSNNNNEILTKQNEQFKKYEIRDRKNRIFDIRNVIRYITNEEALYALKLCNNSEEETILKLSSDFSFLQQIRKEIALDYNPNPDLTVEHLVPIADKWNYESTDPHEDEMDIINNDEEVLESVAENHSKDTANSTRNSKKKSKKKDKYESEDHSSSSASSRRCASSATTTSFSDEEEEEFKDDENDDDFVMSNSSSRRKKKSSLSCSKTTQSSFLKSQNKRSKKSSTEPQTVATKKKSNTSTRQKKRPIDRHRNSHSEDHHEEVNESHRMQCNDSSEEEEDHHDEAFEISSEEFINEDDEDDDEFNHEEEMDHPHHSHEDDYEEEALSEEQQPSSRKTKRKASSTTTRSNSSSRRRTSTKRKSKSTTGSSSSTTTTTRLLLDDALTAVQTKEGWSKARIEAYAKIKTNPNVYYYRFNEPGESQRNGKWSEQEKAKFIKKLKEYLAETDNFQWGIFSKRIPGRVGYQCSNFYRTLLKSGEIKEDWVENFKRSCANNNSNSKKRKKSSSSSRSSKKKKMQEEEEEEEEHHLQDDSTTVNDSESISSHTESTNTNTTLESNHDDEQDEEESEDEEAAFINYFKGFIDPITSEEIEEPAISPYGHVLGYKTWLKVLNTEPRNTCPFTKQPLTKRNLTKLNFENFEEFREKILNVTD
ncbi:hypothetical protein FDP41_006249 [Naegleria fowleri]|uniref:Myb-like domain-containing protein n=1 Tax=Naegleria fowleri TaxID=5763 RepID=A0A6A5BMI1_NAEFO|nr:uncharacterized protein FDP41_006249 [Naegleria fowleri]KAF0974775.1 hypothetical protein FDP41_006249 [Naegleria fowleri]